MREKKDVLAKWLTLEVGKPLQKVLVKLVVQLIFLNGIAEETKRIFGQTQSK
jgi:succinate-semialdehyde dehydrogenase/glutarate-semialdehyde dehydrogenase